MDGLTKHQLRLECLKLAAVIEPKSSGPSGVTMTADKLVAWVLDGSEAQIIPPAKKAAK